MNVWQVKSVGSDKQERKRRLIEFYSPNRHREGQNGQFWAPAWQSLTQPYGFEENVNTSINLFKSGKSDGRIKRYRRPKFVRSRSNETNCDFSNVNNLWSNRRDLRVKLNKCQIFSNRSNRMSGWRHYNKRSTGQPNGKDQGLYRSETRPVRTGSFPTLIFFINSPHWLFIEGWSSLSLSTIVESPRSKNSTTITTTTPSTKLRSPLPL